MTQPAAEGGKAGIAFVAKRFHSNQAPLVRALVERGHKVEFYAEYVGRSEDHALVEPVVVGRQRLLRVSKGSHYSTLSYHGLAALRTMLGTRAKLVVIRDFTLGNLLLSVGLRLRARKIVAYTQDTFHTPRYPLMKRLFHRLFAADVITPTDLCTAPDGRPLPDRAAQGALARWHWLPFVAPVPADLPDSPALQAPPQRAMRILTIAKFAPRKMIVEWVDLAARLVAEGRAIDLHLVGAPLDADVLAKLRERVRQHPFVRLSIDVPHACMGRLFSDADLFVLPSIDEPASVSQLEAMAHGVPAVCSDSNGTACYVAQGKTGHVFAARDWERSLAAAVRRAHDEWSAGTFCRSRCADHVRRHFGFARWEAFLNEMGL